MKVKFKATATLTWNADSAQFKESHRTVERMLESYAISMRYDPHFFIDDNRTEYEVIALEVDGVKQPQEDWLPEVEEVAAAIHSAWMDEKLAQGVTSRKADDGEELMVPYEQLSEKARASNRNLVRTVYAAIADAKDA